MQEQDSASAVLTTVQAKMVMAMVITLAFLMSCGARYPRSVLPDPQSPTTSIQLKQVPETAGAPAEGASLIESDVQSFARGDSELKACVAFLFANPSFRNSKRDVLCINVESRKEIYRFVNPAALSDSNLREILTRSPPG